MKRILCILLVLTLFLSGCAGDPSNTTPSTNATGKDDPVYTACLQNVQNLLGEQNNLTTTSPLLEYDPNREVYISVANQDCDFYPNYWWWKCTALVITRDIIDPNQIQVSVPAQTEYSVQVTDLTEYVLAPAYDSEQSSYGLKQYQYMSMKGIDWEEIARTQALIDTAQSLASKSNGEERQTYIKIATDMGMELDDIFTSAEQEYRKMSYDEIPKFGAYRVTISFYHDLGDGRGEPTIGSHEETVKDILFTIAGKEYPVNVGEWRFHTEKPEILNIPNKVGLKQINMAASFLSGSPYTNGVIELKDAFHFTAEEDLTVTGYQLVGTQLEILGAQVQNGKQAAYYWDMERPIEVSAGDEVKISVYLRDERFALYDVYITTALVMHYQIRGDDYRIAYPCGLIRFDTGVWDAYLMAFEGIDIGAYHLYDDSLAMEWYYALPEAWLKQE